MSINGIVKKTYRKCNTLSISSSCFMEAVTKAFLDGSCFDILKKILGKIPHDVVTYCVSKKCCENI